MVGRSHTFDRLTPSTPDRDFTSPGLSQDRQQVQRPARLTPAVRQVTCLTAQYALA